MEIRQISWSVVVEKSKDNWVLRDDFQYFVYDYLFPLDIVKDWCSMFFNDPKWFHIDKSGIYFVTEEHAQMFMLRFG